MFFAYEYKNIKNFFSKISYTNIKKNFFYSNTVGKEKGNMQDGVEEAGILGLSPDTKEYNTPKN